MSEPGKIEQTVDNETLMVQPANLIGPAFVVSGVYSIWSNGRRLHNNVGSQMASRIMYWAAQKNLDVIVQRIG